MERNTSISILKALGIIFVVAGHAEPPDLISNFIYIFHMPLFFMAAGYFFSQRNLDDPWKFCTRRVKGLYIPFLKFSILFLLLHNLLFDIGLMNETYGNWTGGVTHPYTVQMFFKRLFLIVTSMSGYDEFMAGAFWFFRGLLIASLLFLILCSTLRNHSNLSIGRCAAVICVLALAFNAYRFGFGLKISTIPNGGLREIWGVFFFGAGVIMRRVEDRIGSRIWLTIPALAILCAGAWFHTCGMNNSGQMRDLITLPLTGVSGWIVTRHLASLIDIVESPMKRLLVYIGNNTLYVFVFHIISYKSISALKILWYGLDPAQIGCHMVIHYNNHADLFWILYTIAGVGIPIGVLALYRALKPRLVLQRR